MCTHSQVVEKKQAVMNLEHLQANRFRQIVNRFQQLNDALAIFSSQSSPTSKDILVLHAVVATEASADLINDLSWLSEIQHIAFHYQRANNGVRVVFSDGVFCELYLHEPQHLQPELAANWKLDWQLSGHRLAGFPDVQIQTDEPNRDWLAGELLTNLVIGLRAFVKGEKFSAFLSIQQQSVTYLLKLVNLIQDKHIPEEIVEDWELRFPELKEHLPHFAAGYTQSPESSVQILRYLESLLPINHFIKDQILNLAESCQKPE